MKNKNVEQVREAFSLESAVTNAETNEFKDLMSYAETFQENLQEEKRKQPYHINLMEELRPNENAHSRILCKLLQCKNPISGEYEILNSLLNYIQEKTKHNDFKRIKLINPIITQETARIDLWIRDKETRYAVIFENKVYYAQEQPEQIARYIERTMAEDFRKENIFVVYLSPYRENPNSQSWIRQKDEVETNYEQEFSDRFVNLSFSNDVIKWLKEDVLPNIRQKDTYLNSAVTQYIDYLEFYFQLKNNDLKMNIKKFIEDYFELDKVDYAPKRYELLQEKIENMKEIVQSMESLKTEYWNKLLTELPGEWKEKIKHMYPDVQCIEAKDIDKEHQGYLFDILLTDSNNKNYYAIIGYDGNLYCQVEYDRNLSEEERVIKDSELYRLKEILPSENLTQIWKYYNQDYDSVFNCFCEVVERCIVKNY